MDENAKFVDKFKINGNEVYKLQGATYQLHHREALPKEGKFYFDIKLVQIKNSNIVVGVITDKLIEEQSSFKKIDCVCYNGHDGSICEQEKQKFVGIRPKDGNKIRTVIDVTQTIIEWHLIGNDAKCLIGKAVLPETMSKQFLYPFFELYWEGSKLKMNLWSYIESDYWLIKIIHQFAIYFDYPVTFSLLECDFFMSFNCWRHFWAIENVRVDSFFTLKLKSVKDSLFSCFLLLYWIISVSYLEHWVPSYFIFERMGWNAINVSWTAFKDYFSFDMFSWYVWKCFSLFGSPLVLKWSSCLSIA